MAQESYFPPQGFIPDEKTAIAVAEAVLFPVYGEGKIRSEEPFKATLKNGVWRVEGTLPSGYLGGVAELQMNKSDGKILKMIHGK